VKFICHREENGGVLPLHIGTCLSHINLGKRLERMGVRGDS